MKAFRRPPAKKNSLPSIATSDAPMSAPSTPPKMKQGLGLHGKLSAEQLLEGHVSQTSPMQRRKRDLPFEDDTKPVCRMGDLFYKGEVCIEEKGLIGRVECLCVCV